MFNKSNNNVFKYLLLTPLAIFGLPFVLFALLILLIIIWAIGMFIWSNFYPVGTASIPNDYFNAEIAIETWGNKGDGHYIISVKNQFGEHREDLWTDWGPAQRANFYKTEQGWLTILGGGYLAAIIKVPDDGPPTSVPYPKLKNSSPNDISKNWKYLGSIDGHRGDRPFKLPEEVKECFDTHGMVSIYRPAYQFDQC